MVRPRMERLRGLLIPIVFAVGGVVFAHHEMVLSGFRFTQADLGDTRLVNYLLEHGHRWLAGHPLHARFWDPPFFYPAKGAMAYADLLLGALPLYSPFRLLGLPPDRAFQAWILALGLANFGAAFAFLHRCLKLRPFAASVGAALFAYAATRVNMTMHYQLFPHFWSVLAVYALFRLFEHPDGSERGRVGWIALFYAAGVGQLYAGFYLGWYLALCLFLAGVAALAVPPWRRRLWALLKSHPIALAVGAVISAAALSPMAVHYLEVARQQGMRPFGEVLTMVPRPQSWLYFGPYSWFYGELAKAVEAFRAIPMEHEQRAGFGLLTTAACVAGVVLGRRRAAVQLIAGVGLALVLLSTLYGDFTPWRWVYELFPGAKAVRAVSRISLVVLFPIAVGVALLVDGLMARGRALGAAAVLLGLTALVEQGQTTPAFDFHRNRADVAKLAARVNPERCQAFLFSPDQGYGPYWKYQLDAMWASLEANVPTLNGYSGSSPPGWGLGDTNLHSARDEHRVAFHLSQWVRTHGLDPARICWEKVAMREGPYDAQLTVEGLPPAMIAGQRYPVRVVAKNTGEAPWPAGKGFRLGTKAPRDNTLWGLNRVELPAAVAPGETATFELPVVAPSAPGVYPFQWRLLQERVRWFGDPTPLVGVNVVSPPEEKRLDADRR